MAGNKLQGPALLCYYESIGARTTEEFTEVKKIRIEDERS